MLPLESLGPKLFSLDEELKNGVPSNSHLFPTQPILFKRMFNSNQ